jgi:peptidoglycan/LPS O-acetylase OafA/YrhL
MDVVPLRREPERPQKTNFAGFDAIRALAALGVLLLHACVPYLQHPMPGLAWPVRDSQSALVDVLFWGIELFIMPVFLVMAGMLAWQSLHRHGPGNLVKTRARRLLIPLAFGILVILPLDLYAWLLGWIGEGLIPAVKLKSLKFDNGIDRDLWGLSHLWFLEYLFLYVAVLAGASVLAGRSVRFARLLPSTNVAFALLLVSGAVTLWFRPEVVWGFQHSFLPVASKWLYSGTFFLGGVLIAKSDPQLTWLTSQVPRFALPCLALAACTVMLGRWQLAGGQNTAASTLLAVMTTVSAWGITLCIIAWATKKVTRLPVSIQYLCAASFWIYVVHHPLMGLIHTDLKWLLPGVAPGIKSMIAWVTCAGFCLLLYEGFVRKTALGQWLGFAWSIPRQPPTEAEIIIPIGQETEPISTRRAA